jgi:hypothetical protein
MPVTLQITACYDGGQERWIRLHVCLSSAKEENCRDGLPIRLKRKFARVALEEYGVSAMSVLFAETDAIRRRGTAFSQRWPIAEQAS